MNNKLYLYLGTEDGILVYTGKADQLSLTGRGIEGNAVRGIAIHPENPEEALIACGLRGQGLHWTQDGGNSFSSIAMFEDKWVWDVCFDPHDPHRIFVGTEPPMLYVSTDNGETFAPLEGINQLPSKPQWKFFHPPYYAGHIHGIAVNPFDEAHIIAGVEHGALIFSKDGGETWEERLIGYDVHRVAFHPAQPGRVLVGAGEGLLYSQDNGHTWNVVEPLKNKYIHSIVYDPENPDRIYVYVYEEKSPVYRSDDGGKSWTPVGQGLPPSKPADNLMLHPADSNTLFYTGDRDGKSILYRSEGGGNSWQVILEGLPKVWRVKAAVG